MQGYWALAALSSPLFSALKNLDIQFAAKHLAEISPFLAEHPDFKVCAILGRQFKHDALAIDFRCHINDAAIGPVAHRLGKAQEHHGLGDEFLVCAVEGLHGAIGRIRAGFPEIARNGRDDVALFGGEAEDFRVSDQVIRVAVASAPIDKRARLVQQRSGREPAFVFGRAVHALDAVR